MPELTSLRGAQFTIIDGTPDLDLDAAIHGLSEDSSLVQPPAAPEIRDSFVLVRPTSPDNVPRIPQYDHSLSRHYETMVLSAALYLGEILEKHAMRPVFGITLGSWLGEIAGLIKNALEIPYRNIPYFPLPTIHGHEGTLVIGEIEGVLVMGLKGRTHYYEVADQLAGILQTVFAVNVLAELGVRNYFVTNAAGRLNLSYNVGDLMVLRSHINGLPNPLLGRPMNFRRVDDGTRVVRFPPMNAAYDPALRRMLITASAAHEGHIHEGVYIAVPGPSYETEAESLAFRRESDAVGMSTTNEVIAARNRGMDVVGMSIITNAIEEDGTNATSHEEVAATLNSEDVRARLVSTVLNFFRMYGSSPQIH